VRPGAQQGQVRLVDQRFGIGAVGRIHGNAHARRDVYFLVVDAV